MSLHYRLTFMSSISGNLLVVQMGDTPVMNASVGGVIMEALEYVDSIEEIYGSPDGFDGLLGNRLIDLSAESKQTIDAFMYTPNSILGHASSIQSTNCDAILKAIEDRKIRYLICIGDRNAQQAAKWVHDCAQKLEYDLKVIGIPQSIENEIPITDHSLGYASFAKYMTSLIAEVELRHNFKDAPVFILEVPGKHSGWLAAATSLSKNKWQRNKKSHLVYLPEKAFIPASFIENVTQNIQEYGRCVVVVSEGIVDETGNALALSDTTLPVRDLLANILAQQRIHAVAHKLDMTLTTLAQHISKCDSQEAYACGQDAVEAVMNGESGKMITLLRKSTDQYALETSLTSLDNVLENATKIFPVEWLDECGSRLGTAFNKYLAPLIFGEVACAYEQGWPKFARLNSQVEKPEPFYGNKTQGRPRSF